MWAQGRSSIHFLIVPTAEAPFHSFMLFRLSSPGLLSCAILGGGEAREISPVIAHANAAPMLRAPSASTGFLSLALQPRQYSVNKCIFEESQDEFPGIGLRIFNWSRYVGSRRHFLP